MSNPNFSPYGKVFTPKGKLRILVIYAGFSNTRTNPQGALIKVGDQNLDGWNNEYYDNLDSALGVSVPTYVDPITGAMPTSFFSDTTAFATYCVPSDTTNLSISRYYYDMSLGKFKIMADVFKDSASGKPIRINIDPTGASNWATLCNRVMQKMKLIYPTFDWSPYDQRTNNPFYKCDNSITGPDMKPDYVVMVFRYSSGWAVQPVSGMQSWVGSRGAYSVLRGLGGINYNGYTFDESGYTLPSGAGSGIASFVHELGHELFSAPHILGANGTAGERFYIPSAGWGMATTLITNLSANAWERWLLGWTQNTANGVNADIEDQGDLINGGIYTLRDFITTGDAVRVKIPGTQQHLWIENHQKKSVWDHQPWRIYSPSIDGEKIPDMEKGIYMYVEDVLPARESITTQLVANMNAVNGIKIINAQGNFDYERSLTGSRSSNYYWNNMLYDFKRAKSNPYSGTNPLMLYHDNFPSESTGITDTLINFGDNGYNFSSKKECYYIARENNGSNSKLLYGNTGGLNSEAKNIFVRRSDAFQVGDSINMGTNPAISNYPKYIESTRKLDPVYLNSLSIEVLSQSGDNITMKIKLDNYKIFNDTRITGGITLNNLSGDVNPDLDLQANKTINIDISGYANRHTLYNGKFVNPTVFTCKESSFVKMNNGSSVIVDNRSTFKMESTSKLEINSGAVFTVKNSSILNLADDAQIIVKEGGKLLIEKGSSIQLNGNSRIILENPQSFAQLNSTLELRGTSIITLNGTSKVIAKNKGQIHVKDTAQFKITANAELQYDNGASLILENSNSCLVFNGKIRIASNTQFKFIGNGYMKVTQSTGEFIPGSNSSVKISGANNTDQIIDITDSAKLTFPKGLAQLLIFNGKITMNHLTKVNVYCKARIAFSKFTSWNGNSTSHQGLTIYGQGGVYITSCTFEKGSYGIYNTYNPSSTRQGGKLYISSSVFQNLGTAYYQYGGGFGVFNTNFINNNNGIITNIIEVNSELNGCNFDGNLNYGVRFIGTGTATLSLNGTNVSGSNKGIYSFGNNQTNLKCATFSNNTNSIYGYFDPSFNLSSELNLNGTVSFYEDDQIFSFYHAGDLFLAEGFNNFFPSHTGNNEIIIGTQNRYVTSSLGYMNAINNDWNGSGVTPVYSSDYEVTSSETNHYNDPIYYGDDDPTTMPFECESIEPCTNCPASELNPLKTCDCENLTTTNISNLPLNIALQNIISELDSASTITDREASVIKLKEILTYSMSSINEEERYLLKFAYRMFKDELALCISDSNYVDSASLSTNELLNNYLGYFTDILAYQIDVPTNQQLFGDNTILLLDEALSHKLTLNHSMALDKTDDLIGVVDNIKDPYVAYWTCILTNEVEFKAGAISQDDFESYTSSCWEEFIANYEGMNTALSNNSGNYPLGTQAINSGEFKHFVDEVYEKESVIENVVHEASQLNVFPNPTSSSFTLLIPEVSNAATVRVYNMFGQEVIEKIITNSNEVFIDLSDEPNGYYICTVLTTNSKYEAKIVKIN
jgi:hypothetical protein